MSAQKNQTECAKILGMHRTNVSLEISRNKDPDGAYRGGHAHKRYLERRREAKYKSRKIENDEKLRKYIVRKLKKFWSPEQIAGRLNRAAKETIICHETIYAFVHEKRPDLAAYLRHQKCKYRKKISQEKRLDSPHEAC